MIGEDFSFDGSWLSDFNMKMYDPEEVQKFASREIIKSDITTLKEVTNYYSTYYSETLVLSFFIVKNPDIYDSTSEIRMTAEDIDIIHSWLESPKRPMELFVMPNNEEDYDVYYIGTFTDIQPFVLNQECYGLYLTFTCNAPYGFSPINSTVYNLESDETSGNFYNHSSEKYDYLRPVIEISSNSEFDGVETISIENETDNDKEMKLTPPSGTKTIIVDCRKRMVADENENLLSLEEVGILYPQDESYDFVSAETVFMYWLRLKHGINRLKFIRENNHSISTVTIKARYPRKAGGF